MEKTANLLELSSRLSEFGNPEVIEKVYRTAQQVHNKNLPEGEEIREFLNMLNLYFYQTNILSGGSSFKSQFKSFISEWLKVKCSKDGTASFQNSEFAALDMKSIIYVLGWAKRIGKGHIRNVEYKVGYGSNQKNNSHQPSENKNMGLNSEISGISLEEKLKLLQKKFKGF